MLGLIWSDKILSSLVLLRLYWQFHQTVDGIHYLHNPISMLNSFVFYLKSMVLWLEKNQYFEYDQVSIILDNCSTHRSIKTGNYLSTKPWNIYFLPPYSPQLVTVELAFDNIKAHIKSRNTRNILKLIAAKALSYSLEIMKPIEAKKCKRLLLKLLWKTKTLRLYFFNRNTILI